MPSPEACDRLGVRPQTLYAYVSRGLLHPRKEGRRSWFDVTELDALAASGRRRTRSGRLEVLIDTDLTLLDPAGRLCYRGVDVTTIAGHWSFERTASWLWTGVDDGEPAPWPEPRRLAVAGSSPADRVRAAAAALAATAPPGDRDLGAITEIGPHLVSSLVGALALVGREAPGPGVACHLWPRLSHRPATPARIAALDAALVLLADHELAASTVAARVAASVWTPPLDAVVAAMATSAGALHGGAGPAIEEALRGGGPTPNGFGHAVYRDRDPRADALLPFVRATAPRGTWAAVQGALERGGEAAPNVDLALAALAVVNDMVAGASAAIFAIARTAGWLAHAAEEYRNPFRFRPRASYTGARP